MKELLYWIVEWIAKIHSHILRLNDAYEYNFTDKELHFLVIGMMGMGFIFVVYPVFKWLAKHEHVMVIAWIYVLTLMGVFGFIVMFLVFSVLRGIYKLIRNLIRGDREDE